MGHSRGAAVALSADPDSIDSLVLLSPAGLARAHLTPGVLWRRVAWLVLPNPRTSGRLVQCMAGAEDNSLNLLVEWMTLVGRNTRTTGAPRRLPREVSMRWRGRSTRLLVGSEDVLFPPRRLDGPSKRCLGERVEVIHGAGHLLGDQRTDAVATALIDALASSCGCERRDA